jgi:hypothetical protein
MMTITAIKKIDRRLIRLRIVGTSPLIQHQWSKKAKEMMREKHAGKKTKNREVRDIKGEAEEAAYKDANGKYGVPAMAIKSAIIGAAHKDLGIEKTLVKKSLFLVCYDENGVIPFDSDIKYITREDCVRVGAGSADLRYRPEFRSWGCLVVFEIDNELLKQDDIINLIDRAGFGVGICEWRPEKGGEFGRFTVDCLHPVEEVLLS